MIQFIVLSIIFNIAGMVTPAGWPTPYSTIQPYPIELALDANQQIAWKAVHEPQYLTQADTNTILGQPLTFTFGIDIPLK